MKNIIRLSECAILMAIAIHSVNAGAQSESSSLEEIVVTATKRAESIKDVPVSVAVVGREQIQDLGLSDIKDVSMLLPNFEFSNDPILPNLYVRGLGSGVSQIIEQSIGTFSDGVYQGRATTSSQAFLDIGSIEVLRGTQGTLFGKNTVAGALIINTADPTDEFDAGVDVTVGSYSTTGDHYKAEAFLSGPLSENLQGRIAVLYGDSDGYVENSLNGPDGGAREDVAIRGKLAWQVSDTTEVKLKAEYSNYETEGQVSSEIIGFEPSRNPALRAAFQEVAPQFEDELNFLGHVDCSQAELRFFCPQREQDYQNITLSVDHDFDFATLSSITGYQNYDYVDQFVSIDVGLIGGAFQATRDESYNSFSQEFRLTSEASGEESFDYILGLFYETVDLERLQEDHFNVPAFTRLFLGGNGAGPNFDREENWALDTTTLAAFGQARWHMSDSVTLSLGGRLSYEEKEFDFIRKIDQYYSNTNISTIDFPKADRDETEFTPSANVEWDINDLLNAYYTYAEGHKTGGFSDRLGNTPENIEFSAEFSTMHEIGFKGASASGKLDYNIALFNMEMDDLQVARVGTNDECGAGAFCFVVQNAAEVTSRGLELDFRFYATDNLTFGGAYAYTDASYDRFSQAGCPIGVGGTCDISGQTLIFAPENKGNVYAQLRREMSNGWTFKGLINASYSSDYYGSQELDSEVRQDSFTLFNGSLKLVSPSGKFSVALIGRNLTDEAVLSLGIPVPGGQPYAQGSSSPPRDISIRASYRF